MQTLEKSAKEWANFLPAIAPFFVLLVGMWLIQQVNITDIKILPPDFKTEKIAGNEGLARYWVALSLLIFVVVSVGASAFAANAVWKTAKDKTRRWGFAVTISGLIVLSLIVVGVMEPSPFYEYLGSGVFDNTLKKYPGTPNTLRTLERFIDIGNVVGILAAAFLAAAVCVLVPDKSKTLTAANPDDQEASSDNQKAIDDAAVEIAQQIHLLKNLLGAATLVLLTGLIHMKAWREWPLAYWLDAVQPSAVAFSNLVNATITFQAGHFVCILAAIFLPIAFRLRTESIHLAILEHGELVTKVHETWLSNKGLTLSTSEIVQRAIAIASPFLVPTATEATVLLKPLLENMFG